MSFDVSPTCSRDIWRRAPAVRGTKNHGGWCQLGFREEEKSPILTFGTKHRVGWGCPGFSFPFPSDDNFEGENKHKRYGADDHVNMPATVAPNRQHTR